LPVPIGLGSVGPGCGALVWWERAEAGDQSQLHTLEQLHLRDLRVFRMDLIATASGEIKLAKARLDSIQEHELSPELAIRILAQTARVHKLLPPQRIRADRMPREEWEAVFSRLAGRDSLTGQAREGAVKKALDFIQAMEERR